MKTIRKRIFIAALAVLTAILMLLCSCGGAEGSRGDDNTSGDITEPAQTEAVREPFVITSGGGTANVTVIRSDDASDTEIDCAVRVRDAIKKKLGGCDIGNDFIKPGTEHNAETCEILVGTTNYNETAEALADLRYNDCTVRVIGHKLVIAAASETQLNKAVSYFINTVLGENLVFLDSGEWALDFEDYTFRAKYNVNSLKINGHDISEYRIVYGASLKLCEEGAGIIQSTIATATGASLDVVTDKTEAQECEILVGQTNRLDIKADIINYEVYLSGNKLVFDVAGSYSAQAAMTDLYKATMADGGDAVIGSSLSIKNTWRDDEGLAMTEVDGVTADLRIISYNILTIKWGGTATAPRAEGLGMLLATYKPDAMGIQEVCSEWVKYMQPYLGNYKLICNRFANGSENYSSILYDASKYDVVDSGVVAYSMSANALCRNMGWAIFKNKTTGKMFGLISTHWDFDNSENNRESYRKVQAEEITAKVKALNEKYSCPIFTTGDYNSTQDSSSQQYFRSINNMWCALLNAKKKYTTIGSCNGKLGVQQPSVNSIDFVFGTKDSSVLGYKVLLSNKTEYISDHLPVMADIKLP